MWRIADVLRLVCSADRLHDRRVHDLAVPLERRVHDWHSLPHRHHAVRHNLRRQAVPVYVARVCVLVVILVSFAKLTRDRPVAQQRTQDESLLA